MISYGPLIRTQIPHGTRYVVTEKGARAPYYLLRDITYTSERYGRTVTAPAGMRSDGATGAIDIPGTDAWWIHDRICDRPRFDDGTPINAWQAATLLHDLLQADRKWARAVYWRLATFLFGCHKARANGWFRRR